MQSLLYIISVGASESNHLTVEALSIAENSDIIFCPAVKGREDALISKSENVLRNNIKTIEEKISLFELPMNSDRTAAKEVYRRLAHKIKELSAQGKKIAVACEGDASIFSSVQHLSDECRLLNIETVRAAGIPSFIAAAALAGIPLIQERNRLIVLADPFSEAELLQFINSNYNIVIMKPSLNSDLIKNIISNHAISVHYFENIGSKQQYYSSSPSEIAKRDIPYFSIVIIHKQRTI